LQLEILHIAAPGGMSEQLTELLLYLVQRAAAGSEISAVKSIAERHTLQITMQQMQ
jgi:hypothetical protein